MECQKGTVQGMRADDLREVHLSFQGKAPQLREHWSWAWRPVWGFPGSGLEQPRLRGQHEAGHLQVGSSCARCESHNSRGVGVCTAGQESTQKGLWLR